MNIPYFDMLMGDPIPVRGVGSLISPKLRDLSPTHGIGYNCYNLFINMLAWDKAGLIRYARAIKLRGAEKLEAPGVSFFDAISCYDETRELCCEVLSFFMREQLIWDPQRACYIALACDEQGTTRPVGRIDAKNFDEVRQTMLRLNYIGLDKDTLPTSYDSDKARELWEKAQDFLKKQSETEDREDKPEFHLANIISKLCAVHPSYNLLNIYDLTVFQIYDAFFQYGYMRSTSLSEQIFSNHGGNSFKFENWLKPIFHHI